MTSLPGTVHPLASAEADRGAVSVSEPTGRLLLLLKRPAAAEAALQEYLREVTAPGSAVYHHWLTPEEIGKRFGPAETDKAAVDTWLGASGLQVARHSKSGLLVEFSGNVGQINSAFQTSIHQYQIHGEMHRANATALQVPQSLAGVVAGVSPLNDLHAASLLKNSGSARYDAITRKMQPGLTSSNAQGPVYAVTPADFATQYDLGPLTSAGVNGTGETIGIISESNIDVGVSKAFRTVFGLPSNPVQVVLEGTDPGLNGAADEAYLDVERAGGTAPNATINLYTSTTYSLQDPLLLAATRAIDDDQADVLSLSYGEDEQFLGASGNAIWSALWEQAAAQGQTVLVASGDTGSVGEVYDLAVSGLASTPWNIAVGGLDFYYADYAQGAPSAASLWSATNDPVTKGSLLAPLPEQVWNDALGLDAIATGLAYGEIYAGGGGASSCVFGQTQTTSCTSGYPKPSWQMGAGVPADGVRDVPDVSLFAANGYNYSSYAICAVNGDCVPDVNGNFTISLFGGTSASAPSMAGIMALVAQKYGRQGQADPTLYALAQQKPAVFHDTTLGSNETVCQAGTTDCNSQGLMTVYVAGPSYDLASGLGSVDAAALVNDWSTVSYAATATTLKTSATKVVHGQPVTLTTTVAASTGAGTPSGAVAVTTTSPLEASQGVTPMVLSGGIGTETLSTLPGGSYELTARYGGDGTYASSSSSPVSIEITAEPSTLVLGLLPSNTNGATTYYYGGPTYLNAQVLNAKGAADGAATGGVSFTVDGTATTSALNTAGVATYFPAFSVGNHTVSAAYAGDPSYAASTAAPVTFAVQKGYAQFNVQYSTPYGPQVPTMPIGQSLYVGLTATASFGTVAPGTLAPTGAVNFELIAYNPLDCGDNGLSPVYSQMVQLAPVSGQYSTFSTANAVFPNLTAGMYWVCALYAGDANWHSGGEVVVNGIEVTGAQTAPTTTVLSLSPTSLSGSQQTTLTATVNGLPANGPAPTGYVSIYDNGSFLAYSYNVAQNGAQSYVQFPLSVASFLSDGANQLTAVYTGDLNYQPSTSNIVTVTIAQPADFTLTPAVSSLGLNAGASGSVGVRLAAVGDLSGSVAMSCTTSSPAISCSFASATSTLPGPSTAMLNVTATGGTNTAMRAWRGFAGGAAMALMMFFVIPRRRRRMMSLGCVVVLAGLGMFVGCGGNTTGQGQTSSVANYSVTVTGSSSGVVHSAKIAVSVTTTH